MMRPGLLAVADAPREELSTTRTLDSKISIDNGDEVLKMKKLIFVTINVSNNNKRQQAE